MKNKNMNVGNSQRQEIKAQEKTSLGDRQKRPDKQLYVPRALRRFLTSSSSVHKYEGENCVSGSCTSQVTNKSGQLESKDNESKAVKFNTDMEISETTVEAEEITGIPENEEAKCEGENCVSGSCTSQVSEKSGQLESKDNESKDVKNNTDMEISETTDEAEEITGIPENEEVKCEGENCVCGSCTSQVTEKSGQLESKDNESKAVKFNTDMEISETTVEAEEITGIPENEVNAPIQDSHGSVTANDSSINPDALDISCNNSGSFNEKVQDVIVEEPSDPFTFHTHKPSNNKVISDNPDLVREKSDESKKLNDGESWESMFNDDGESLNPEVMKQLGAVMGRVNVKASENNYAEYQPISEYNTGEYECIVELYDFPKEFSTQDLVSALSFFQQSSYTLKWVDDCHALALFSSPAMANQALQLNHIFVKIRPLSEGIKESKEKAKYLKNVEPSKPRPTTSAALARRLVSGALGLKVQATREQREIERTLLKEAKEKRKLQAKQRQDIWDGVV